MRKRLKRRKSRFVKQARLIKIQKQQPVGVFLCLTSKIPRDRRLLEILKPATEFILCMKHCHLPLPKQIRHILQ